MKNLKTWIGLFIIGISLISCGIGKPKSFVKAADSGNWNSIFVREDLTFDKAYNEVLDICSKRFEMDMISKEGGYGRTHWVQTWNAKGKFVSNYRVRVIFKFSPSRDKVDIKTEAEHGGEGRWVKGYDTELLRTMKQDIGGAVGRTVL